MDASDEIGLAVVARPEVERVLTTVGNGAQRDGMGTTGNAEERAGTMTLSLVPPSKRDVTQRELEKLVQEVYCVLVLLFHDFAQPLTIMAALPLSVGGALGLLLAAGEAMSLPATIGILMLMDPNALCPLRNGPVRTRRPRGQLSRSSVVSRDLP